MTNQFLPISVTCMILAGLLAPTARGETTSDEDISACAKTISVLVSKTFPIFDEKICALNVNKTHVEFSLSIDTSTRRPLLSSELSDFFAMFGQHSYLFTPVSETVYLASYAGKMDNSYLGKRFESYIITPVSREPIWIRCSNFSPDGCGFYQDILPRQIITYPDNSNCSTFIRVSFQKAENPNTILDIINTADNVNGLVRSIHSESIKKLCRTRK